MVNIFTPSGRIGRLERFAYITGVGLLVYLININIPSQTGLMFIMLSIVTTYISLMLDIKRFHDIGWDGSFLVMWYLFNILIYYICYIKLKNGGYVFDNLSSQEITQKFYSILGFALVWWFANIVLGCILLFKKGTDGPNEYGPNPLKPDSNYQHNPYQHIYPSFKEDDTIYLTKNMMYREAENFDENDTVVIQRGDNEIVVTNRRHKKRHTLN